MANPVPNDPKNADGKPHGTLRDQEQTMEAEGQPARAQPAIEPSSDPAVDAASIFEKLEHQAASERGEKR